MGLDMYLTASRYISDWEHNKNDAEKKVFADVLKAAGIDRKQVDEGAPSGNVTFHCGYWRKANQIHGWFVKHCQGRKDECQKADVSRDQLRELCGLCRAVLADHAKAAELLPPQNGFFFGGTKLDEYYYQDLEATVAIIERCVDLPECWSFEYQSSW